jgi:hypothetical protein
MPRSPTAPHAAGVAFVAVRQLDAAEPLAHLDRV